MRMMQDIRAKAVGFIRNPIWCGTLIVFGLLSIGAVVLGVRQISYVHPEPAIAVGGLALIVLMVGWVISDLWRAHYSSPARVLGLELLFNRWQAFEPRERDSEILYEQISIALSIAELAYSRLDEIRFVKSFPGTKIKSGTFLLQPGTESQLVLKFDNVENIHKEQERYKHCVGRRLRRVPGEPWDPPQRHGKIQGEDWGAITYSIVGDDLERLQTFGEYYMTHDDPQQIENVLKHIFEALSPWWRNPIDRNDPCARWERNTLYEEYNRLTRKQHQMQSGIAKIGQVIQIETLQNITANHRYVDLDSDLRLRNPLNWVRDVFEAWRLGEWVTEVGLRRNSIVHGDFHAGNVLISEDNYGQLRAWVIDFPHTHVGPTVQDVARLEADIKFGLLPDDTLKDLSIHDMHDFETDLLPESDQPTPPIVALTPKQEEPTNEQLQKAWKAVCLLRSEAQKYMAGYDARPYYLALLHATLPVSYYRDRSSWQKLYAFISAALLCQRLAG